MKSVNLGRIRPIYRGEYAPGALYNPLDFLSFSGNTYFCIQQAQGVTPTNTAYFEPVLNLEALGVVSAWETIAGMPNWPVQMAYDVDGNLSTATYSKGDLRIRQTLSYNVGGDLATVLIEDSVDAGATWSELGIQTLNYDAEGNLTHTEWMGNA